MTLTPANLTRIQTHIDDDSHASKPTIYYCENLGHRNEREPAGHFVYYVFEGLAHKFPANRGRKRPESEEALYRDCKETIWACGDYCFTLALKDAGLLEYVFGE